MLWLGSVCPFTCQHKVECVAKFCLYVMFDLILSSGVRVVVREKFLVQTDLLSVLYLGLIDPRGRGCKATTSK